MRSGGEDDRTTRARIRDGAIAVVASDGVSALSARRVAERVGVSPGSVIHHFGSMDGLRHACDEHVARVVREVKGQAMRAGPALDVTAVLRQADRGPLSAYLAAVLSEDSPTVNDLVDEMVEDAIGYLADGVASEMVKPPLDEQAERGRAAVLILWGLGALVLHRHLRRLLGADLLSAADDPAELAGYATPAYDLLGRGLLTEQTLEVLAAQLANPVPPKPARTEGAS